MEGLRRQKFVALGVVEVEVVVVVREDDEVDRVLLCDVALEDWVLLEVLDTVFAGSLESVELDDVAVLDVGREEEEVDVTTTVEAVELSEELLLERVVGFVLEAILDKLEVVAVSTDVVLPEDDGNVLGVCDTRDDDEVSCVDDCDVDDEEITEDETPPQEELPLGPDEIKE